MKARNKAIGTPGRILVLFALLMAAAAAVVWHNARSTSQPQITWPTAVGDSRWYIAGAPPPEFVLERKRYTLVPKSDQPIQARDDRMFAVPFPVEELRVYTDQENYPPDRLPPLFLKVAEGEFLSVRLDEVPSGQLP
jgi:hypothetical protein